MENIRKGTCINIGNCNQADKEIAQEVSISADFTCSECGRDLIHIEEKKKFKLKKPLLIAIPILILLLIGGGYSWYYFSKAKAIVKATESVVNKTRETIEKGLEKTDSDSAIFGNSTSNRGIPANIETINGKSNKGVTKSRIPTNSLTATETSGKLRKALLNISERTLSFNQRISKVDEAMANIFSKNLVIETYINTEGVASHLWDKGHGKDYLEHLAMEESIIDFKILAHKGSIPNISYLQVIEVHKQ